MVFFVCVCLSIIRWNVFVRAKLENKLKMLCDMHLRIWRIIFTIFLFRCLQLLLVWFLVFFCLFVVSLPWIDCYKLKRTTRKKSRRCWKWKCTHRRIECMAWVPNYASLMLVTAYCFKVHIAPFPSAWKIYSVDTFYYIPRESPPKSV